ncbi:MAG: polyribonucleotide nucleotidyltransferase [Acidobacteria bacterium]|nr:polyribonucleotide nucleotidyltransferase [Acidobacteriota bacterium]
MIIKKTVEIGGKTLTFEMGRIAKQAAGSCTIRLGDTVVLATACASDTPREGIDFLPLTVDYREWTYAAGKIPGGFFKREGRPNQKETLTCRLIDRPIRPLFPEGWGCETQTIGMVLSSDQENDSDVLAVCGIGAALYCSNIPFHTPLAAVRIGRVNDQFVINPTFSQLEESVLDLTVAGTPEAIVMVEAGAKEVSEEIVLEAMTLAHENIRTICAVIQEMHDEVKPKKRTVETKSIPEDVMAEVRQKVHGPLGDAMRVSDKIEAYAQVDKVKAGLMDSLPEDDSERRFMASKAFKKLQCEIMADAVMNDNKRLDGRALDQVRAISCEVGYLPRTHGSSLFTRGETQALVTATLGTASDAQRLDYIQGAGEKRFMLHYNFPPFSVGEARFMRGPGRREIGHGALAERAIIPVLPSADESPYTVRIVSEILESNGSSSMATVCGASLALMDAGIPIKKPVAGIAMGLIEAHGKMAILSDIAGAEDHYGDMDFKVTGTRDGITALQMDIKITGITTETLSEAMQQAKRGRLHILDKMAEALEKPRADISQYAPRIISVQVPKDKIRDVIGTGGKVIRSIVERTGCKIEVNDDGRVDIASVDAESAAKAKEIILELTAEAEIDKSYLGKVVRITNFGAFVEIMPSVDGLLHISEIAHHRVNEVTDILKEGEEVMVKVLSIDAQGKIRLSRKALLDPPAKGEGDSHGDRDRNRRPSRGGDRHGQGRGQGGGSGRST